MRIRKKLLGTFGPILISVLLVLLLFLTPFKIDLDSQTVLSKASTSMATNMLKGNAIKNKAMSSNDYIPFFGSSELSRISPFHPSVLAEKYNRDYRPFLVGAPGTQSLTQSLIIQSMGENLSNKKAVFILSPQWFVKNGINEDYFNAYYSELQIYQWISTIKTIDESDAYLAKRLLDFPKVQENKRLANALTNVKNHENIGDEDLIYFKQLFNVLSREDELFGKIGMTGKDTEIKTAEKELPTDYNFDSLNQLASQIGKEKTNNNSFEIANTFYKNNLEKNLSKLENSQKGWDYRFSPEYSDLQLVLNQFAEKKIEVLFIIPPVNKKWSDYTGLSQEMLQEFASKVKYQLVNQGFTTIADYTKNDDTPYFMADTIHLGWRGWLDADQRIKPFLEKSSIDVPKYQLNNYFYSEKWQSLDPKEIENNK